MFLCDYRVTQATHQKHLRHTIDYRADQFTFSKFEIHSNTCHERKLDKAPANFRLQPICQKDRLQYIYHDQNTEQHPFNVKSSWIPPIQRSVALETYLEEVKIKLAETPLVKPKNNLPPGEQRALKELMNNKEIILKKADKGTTTVVMN